MKKITNILFVLCVVVTSIDVCAETMTCDSGQFLHPDDGETWSCKNCPSTCKYDEYLPNKAIRCKSCGSSEENWDSTNCGQFSLRENRTPKGFFCKGGDLTKATINTGIENCPDAYPYTSYPSNTKGGCWVKIPFDIGTNATFRGKTTSIVEEIMVGGGISNLWGGENIDGMVSHTMKINDDINIPTRTGYAFARWEVTTDCGENPTYATIDVETVIQPVWNGATLCTKIRAVWCSDEKHEVSDGSGGCICKRGYYMNGTACTKCPDGSSTLEPGATSVAKCEKVFQYKVGSDDGFWAWPDAVTPGEFYIK